MSMRLIEGANPSPNRGEGGPRRSPEGAKAWWVGDAATDCRPGANHLVTSVATGRQGEYAKCDCPATRGEGASNAYAIALPGTGRGDHAKHGGRGCGGQDVVADEQIECSEPR